MNRLPQHIQKIPQLRPNKQKRDVRAELPPVSLLFFPLLPGRVWVDAGRLPDREAERLYPSPVKPGETVQTSLEGVRAEAATQAPGRSRKASRRPAPSVRFLD